MRHVLRFAVPAVVVAGGCAYAVWPAPETPSAVIPAVVTPATPAQTGALRFDAPEFDAGDTQADIRHTFVLRNHTEAAVTITGVTATCSCVLGEPDRKVVPPGETTTLGVTGSVLNKAVGPHRFGVTVAFEAGGVAGSVTAAIRANYAPDVRISPASLEFVVGDGPAAVASVSITDFRETSLRVLRVQSTSPRVRAKVEKTPTAFQAGWQHVLTVECDETADAAAIVTITTDDPARATIPIPVRVTAVTRIRVSPAALNLDAATSAGTVLVRDSRGETLDIEGVDVVGAGDTATVSGGGGPTRTVAVARAAGVSSAAELVIRVRKPCPAVIRVPV